MKRMVTLLSLTAILVTENQTIAQNAMCSPPTATANLDVNNVNATILNGGDMWRDMSAQAGYEIPKGSGNHVFYTQGLWLAGQQAGSGSLSTAGVMYRSSGSDFYPGPLDSLGNVSDITCSAFDGVYAMTKTEVDSQIAGVSTSYHVRIWPGRGNPITGMPLQDLAPFIDVNGDGIYNSAYGDYPDIKGDKALWFVYNDRGNLHTETLGEQIGVEIHVMAYAYTGTGHENNTTFYDYTIFNKGVSMSNFYMGLFTDVDLGNSLDDFIGCDSTRGIGYVYNSSSSDLHYGINPPAAGIKTVVNPHVNSNSGMSLGKFTYFNNYFGSQGSPTFSVHFYNYLRGYWKDGSPFVQGGSAHFSHPAADSTSPVNFVYPGMPSDNSQWSECQTGQTGGDRRMLMSYGPMDFVPGDTLRFTSAALYSRDQNSPAGCGNQIPGLLNVSDLVQEYHDSITDCGLFNPQYQISFAHPDAGQSNGSIEVSFTGNTPEYFWSGNLGSSPTLTGLDTGLYKLVMHNGKNCYDIVNIALEEPSGISNISPLEFRLFPNPAGEETRIELTDTEIHAQVDLLDLTGKLILRSSFIGSTHLNTSNLTQGVYFVKVSSGPEMHINRLLVVH